MHRRAKPKATAPVWHRAHSRLTGDKGKAQAKYASLSKPKRLIALVSQVFAASHPGLISPLVVYEEASFNSFKSSSVHILPVTGYSAGLKPYFGISSDSLGLSSGFSAG